MVAKYFLFYEGKPFRKLITGVLSEEYYIMPCYSHTDGAAFLLKFGESFYSKQLVWHNI
jgi:hypothetical protein